MAQGLVQPQWSEKNGTVRIANEVVGIIAGLAATEVRGVAGMSGGVVDGISELLKKKNLSKGVRVEVGEKEAAVDLYVVIEYGARIPDVAIEIQENVKRAIEGMTGLKVVEVNVHIQGVQFQQEEPPLEEEESRVT
ncbi:MAG: Asp23/Gls24 family envelope stress response protein [Firmicutes bacterium]|nr:Asp23/Gls24 family envelope stress response protein [Bacillota bacterium]